MAVHQCARFQINPKRSHEMAVKRIVRYLLATRDKGIIIKPNNNLDEIQCYVDADFAGSYTQAESDDPSSVKSRTGYLIKYAGLPVAWKSIMQTEIALSTTEAEYIALSTATRDLISMRLQMLEISKTLGIPCTKLSLKCTLFEDNKASEELAKVPKIRPQTKHIAIKYHHFR